MSFILLWIEIFLAATLFAAMFIAITDRRKTRLARIALYGVGLIVPAIPLALLTMATGGMYLMWHMQGVGFIASIVLLLAFVAAFVVIRNRASRLDAAGLTRASAWSPGRIGIAFLVVLAILFSTYWNLALQSQIEIQALRTKAGAMALSVAPAVAPDSENAAPVYQRAAQSYMEAVTKEDEKIDYRDLDPHSPEVAAYLERQKKTLDLIRRAADMPAYRPDYDYTDASEAELELRLKGSGVFRAQANLLAVAAKAESAGGRQDLALDDCRRIYSMSAHIGTAPMLINGLISVAIDALASRTVVQVLSSVTSKEQLDRLPPLDPGATSRTFSRCLRSEEAFGLARFCDYGSGDFNEGNGPRVPPTLAAGMWMLWMHEDMTMYLATMQRMRELADQPYYQALPQLKQLEADFSPESGRPSGPLTSILFPSMNPTVRTVSETEALRSCTTLAVAATRYRLAHNHQYPDAAQALIPEFLDSVPLDPFDGKPLRLKKNDDSSLTFYSIGRDMTDNGGEVESKKSDSRPLDLGLTLKP